ncbi:hypothetical protein [Limnobacter parvus]|uniref:Group 4 capsule polysaccharide lipoprotein gfcB, YjbF n=1 Tax=Limnobacter parvus TaxID=2939690 RepID=A0ABT1XIY0_9BURK|nr:hypothetical protein [Limnobacter parvus]MCR2746859.1 hypothetical protein [Limnobacter parvus]
MKMLKTGLRGFLGVAFGFICLLFQPVAWGMQAVVLESNVKALPAGTLLQADAVLSVAKSGVVTVVAENGSMKTIRGPYRGAWLLASESIDGLADVKAALGRLLTARSEDTSTLGTVRRLGSSTEWLPAHAKQGWNVVSAEHEGVQCIVPSQRVQLLRQNSQGAELAALRKADSTYQPIHWSENAAFAVWPDSVPIQSEDIYLLRRTGSSIPYRLQIIELAPGFAQSAPVYQLATLLAHRCVVQATLLKHAENL